MSPAQPKSMEEVIAAISERETANRQLLRTARRVVRLYRQNACHTCKLFEERSGDALPALCAAVDAMGEEESHET